MSGDSSGSDVDGDAVQRAIGAIRALQMIAREQALYIERTRAALRSALNGALVSREDIVALLEETVPGLPD